MSWEITFETVITDDACEHMDYGSAADKITNPASLVIVSTSRAQLNNIHNSHHSDWHDDDNDDDDEEEEDEDDNDDDNEEEQFLLIVDVHWAEYSWDTDHGVSWVTMMRSAAIIWIIVTTAALQHDHCSGALFGIIVAEQTSTSAIWDAARLKY